MGFFSNVGNFFKKAGNSIAHTVKSVVKSREFQSVVNTAKGAVSAVYNDAKGLLKSGQDNVGKLIDKTANLSDKIVDKASDTVLGVSSNLSMPLVIGGMAVLAILLLKK